MNSLCSRLFSNLRYSVLPVCLISTCMLPACRGFAQQSVAKPILSANPAPAPAATQPAPASTGAANNDPTYIIGPADQLQINVWKESGFPVTLPVRPDGMISLPLIGDIRASGYTPMALKDEITTRLQSYITDPNVGVSVLGVNSRHVYMIGEIGHTGPLDIVPGMTILQAIATAGGPSPYAKRKKIYILRGEPGKQKKLFFDYNKALKTGDMQGITLAPGDTIVLP